MLHSQDGLDESRLDPDPFRQFRLWLDQAVAAPIKEPLAMALATATPDGKPSARMVLLRGFDERGFVFFSNYDSRKGLELNANPQAAVVLFWDVLDRQVRIEGRVERATEAESDEYFRSRPPGSRLGAWASRQSQIIASRNVLEAQMAEFERRFPDEIPRPPNWGGYRLVAESIEFWQGRPNRLHDRLRFVRGDDCSWRIERLSP